MANNPLVSVKYADAIIKPLKVDIDGVTNLLYSSDYHSIYSYRDKNYLSESSQNPAFGQSLQSPAFGESSQSWASNIHTENFYNDHFGLLIDLRSINDEMSAGIGRRIELNLKLVKKKQQKI